MAPAIYRILPFFFDDAEAVIATTAVTASSLTTAASMA